jgi:hypothetical protein
VGGAQTDPAGAPRAPRPALTVICAYESLDRIEAAQGMGFEVPAFDLAVMDEAQRLAGRADKKWAIANDAQRIRRTPPLHHRHPAHFRRRRRRGSGRAS